MAAMKAGDRVIVTQRQVTADDAKSGLYYEYFGGLTGTVDRVYDDMSVCVDVDLDSLADSARERHLAMQEAEKKRWLDSLAQEARSRLTPEQQQLKMSYKILVSKKDLEPFTGAKPPKKEAAPAKPKPAEAEPAAKPAPKAEKELEPKRLSQADLDAAEEAALKALQPEKQE
jgi:uncharacterized protein YkvS